ncbi:hypothetical protein [Phenylobacterium sp.]|jgi:hypothetical protein|uniref:hypothetical protein n=1 Tax=Phenylobacterium sp. TaxID=1871053 RepID=UPI002E303461|nr:hypothetical protein [Phenylobacterium sp.]HEX2561951.1 hypothetical protein [Phenylobacterium sp.]
MDENSYTLLAVRPDGAVPVVDLVGGSRKAALARARAFLAEHSSCVHVEVWLEGRMVGQVRRSAAPESASPEATAF